MSEYVEFIFKILGTPILGTVAFICMYIGSNYGKKVAKIF